MGLHPCSVGTNVEEELELVERELNKGKYIAVGEIGMDFVLGQEFSKGTRNGISQANTMGETIENCQLTFTVGMLLKKF